MGYTTKFRGSFDIDKKLDEETAELLIGLAETRRMKRLVGSEFGIDGEFFINGSGYSGQGEDNNIIDYNTPPKTQPSLWCQWLYNKKTNKIRWDGEEKFNCYIEWIKYLIDKVLEPRGYVVNGEVKWNGEDRGDRGSISIFDNIVSITRK